MGFGPPMRAGAGPSRPGAGDPRRTGFRASISSLENQQYRWLFTSNISFFLAMSAQGLVRGWLAYELTGSKLALGLVFFTVAVPMLVVAPIGGVMCDRFDRRNLIAMGQAVIVVSELVMLTLILTETIAFWHLVVGAGVMGCVFPFIMPARQALVVNIVGKRGLPNAMALSMAGMNFTRVAGPALAGFLLGPLGVGYTYIVGVGLYGIAVLSMLRVHHYPPEDRPIVSVWANLKGGATYVRDHDLVLILILFGLIPMFLAMPFQSLLVVFAKDVWNTGEVGLGLLSAAGGIGGVLGSFYIAWQASSDNRVRRMMVSIICFGLFLLAFSMTPYFWSALGLVFVANAFASVYSTLNNTAIQMLIPDEVRGRVSSFLMMSFSLPMLGTLPMGAVAEAYGAPTAVGLASVLAVVVAILFYVTSASLRNMDNTVRDAVAADEAAEAARA